MNKEILYKCKQLLLDLGLQLNGLQLEEDDLLFKMLMDDLAQFSLTFENMVDKVNRINGGKSDARRRKKT